MRSLLYISLLCLLSLLVACGGHGGGGSGSIPDPQWQPSLDPAAWSVRYSPQQALHPGSGWVLPIPVNTTPKPCASDQAFDCPAVHYVTTAGQVLSAKSITFSGVIATTGGATFGGQTEPSNTCATPASARLLLERSGDNLTQDFYRWWSNPQAVVLTAGAFSITVPLAPGAWSSVFGHKGDESATTQAGFADALAHLGNIGFTLGAGCFFSHGAYVTQGSATLTLTAFTLNR